MTVRNRYLFQVARILPCPWKQRRVILSGLRQGVDDFLSQHPDADLNAVITRFGTPQSIAANYLQNAETAEVLRRYRIRSTIIIIIAIAAALAVTIRSAVIAYLAHELADSHPGYIEREVVEGESYETPPWYHY